MIKQKTPNALMVETERERGGLFSLSSKFPARETLTRRFTLLPHLGVQLLSPHSQSRSELKRQLRHPDICGKQNAQTQLQNKTVNFSDFLPQGKHAA